MRSLFGTFGVALFAAFACAANPIHLSTAGEDVASLEDHVVAGEVTVFDFYGTWCGPCRDVDTFLSKRSDIAYRKINIGDWDTPVAKHYLRKVPTLPYVIVYGRDGKKLREISGLDIPSLEAVIAEAARR